MERTLSLKSFSNEEAKKELEKLYEIIPPLEEDQIEDQAEKLKFLKNR